MTEKRYSLGRKGYTRLRFVKDNETDCELANAGVVNRLNEQQETIQYLRKAEVLANHRGEMVGFATSLIDDFGSETMRKMWNEFKEEKYKEWIELK